MGTNVTIGEHSARFIEKKLESGEFGSAEEVIEHALLALELNEPIEPNGQTDEEKLARLRRAWNEGIASGDAGPLDIEAFKREARRRLDAGE
jgi:antitoxin ParD1/3/4